mgnify:CR=1 FL=1
MSDRFPVRPAEVPWASAFSILAAVGLLAAASLSARSTAVAGSNLVVALAVLMLSAYQLFGLTRGPAVGWVVAGLGLWSVVCPWLLPDATPTTLIATNAVIGTAIAGLGCWEALTAPGRFRPTAVR